jgi:4-oxalocrotonate tautomerase
MHDERKSHVARREHASCHRKVVSGKSEEQKTRLAEAIAKDVIEILNSGEEAVSVAFEEVTSQEWAEKVYKSDIKGKWDKGYKKPRYTM